MKINKKVIFIVIGVLLFLIIGWVVIMSSASSGTCGGIGGWKCPEGYFCKMTWPYYPDKSGTCLSDKFPFDLLK